MKVLFQSRSTLFSGPGGDTVQILKTKKYLERMGVSVDISTEMDPDLSHYDLVHLFNLMRPQDLLCQARNAKRQGKKIALSTIYGVYTEYDHNARNGFAKTMCRLFSTPTLEYMKTVARAIKNREMHKGISQYLLCGHTRSQIELLSYVDVFLPNSAEEMGRVTDDFEIARGKPFVVVPNAIDAELFNPDEVVASQETNKYEGCVLCAARFEGRKSQLNLVRAMNSLPWQLVLIGKPAPNHVGYFKQIKREAGENVHILGHVEHDKLPEYYKAAKVHALISWMETPGLASLEAGAMDCNLVITEKGDTRSYFGDYAFYCEPDSVETIRNAIIEAYEAPVNPALRKHILSNFTWDKTAKRTLGGYRNAFTV